MHQSELINSPFLHTNDRKFRFRGTANKASNLARLLKPVDVVLALNGNSCSSEQPDVAFFLLQIDKLIVLENRIFVVQLEVFLPISVKIFAFVILPSLTKKQRAGNCQT